MIHKYMHKNNIYKQVGGAGYRGRVGYIVSTPHNFTPKVYI